MIKDNISKPNGGTLGPSSRERNGTTTGSGTRSATSSGSSTAKLVVGDALNCAQALGWGLATMPALAVPVVGAGTAYMAINKANQCVAGVAADLLSSTAKQNEENHKVIANMDPLRLAASVAQDFLGLSDDDKAASDVWIDGLLGVSSLQNGVSGLLTGVPKAIGKVGILGAKISNVAETANGLLETGSVGYLMGASDKKRMNINPSVKKSSTRESLKPSLHKPTGGKGLGAGRAGQNPMPGI